MSKITVINPEIVEYFQRMASQLPGVVTAAIVDEWTALEFAGVEGIDPQKIDVEELLKCP